MKLTRNNIKFFRHSAFIITGIVLCIQMTNAQYGGGVFSQDQILSFANGDESLQTIGRFFSMIIRLVTFVSLWILNSAGDLMGTEFVTSPKAMNVVLPMWRYVRDLTNIGFVLLLVTLSFTNLYESFSGGGNWDIKNKLPKIIIAIVAVNFSSLGFRIAIDAVNFGSVALLSIADSQLEARSATSMHQIINNKTWKLVRAPKDISRTFTSNKIYDKNSTVTNTDENGLPLPVESEIPYFVNITIQDPEKQSQVLPAVIGQTCNTAIINDQTFIDQGKHYVNQQFYTEQFVNQDKNQGYIAICDSFAESINGIFCGEGQTDSDECMFQINGNKVKEKSSSSIQSNMAQNLFMAMGTQFVRIEKLPVLAANATSLYGVLDSTLFALVLSVAYAVALMAFFIALIARIFVLWVSIICSPAIVGASIIGDGVFDKAKEGIDLFVTHLILPLKISLAFSVSFVMLNGMTEFSPININNGFIEFGPQLSHLALNGQGLVWQVATIFAFWKIARWATEGSMAESFTNRVFDWSEKIGGFLAKSATIENQFIPIQTSDGQGISVADALAAPIEAIEEIKTDRRTRRNAFIDDLIGSSNKEHKKLINEFKFAIQKDEKPANYAKKLEELLPKLDSERITDKAKRDKLLNEEIFAGKTQAERKTIIEKVKNEKMRKALLDLNKNQNDAAAVKSLASFTSDGDSTTSDTDSNTSNQTIKISNNKSYNLNTNPTSDTEKKTTKENIDAIAADLKTASDADIQNLDQDFFETIRASYNKATGKTINTNKAIIEELFGANDQTKLSLYEKLQKTDEYRTLAQNSPKYTELENAIKTLDKTLNFTPNTGKTTTGNTPQSEKNGKNETENKESGETKTSNNSNKTEGNN